MAKRCALTNKDALTGNNVSHSNRKTKRRFLPNIQNITLASETLGLVSLKLAVSTIRTIDKKGGLDQFLLNTANKDLSEEAIKLKNRLKKALNKDNK